MGERVNINQPPVPVKMHFGTNSAILLDPINLFREEKPYVDVVFFGETVANTR